MVGQTALGVEDPTEAAAAVSKAIVDEDKEALSSISAAWRTDFDADALAQHVDQAVTTGPYAVDVIVPGERVELVRNDEYEGDGAASYDRVVVRSDLEPLEQVEALAAGTVDVVAPTDTRDVLDALAEVTGADVRTGGDSTLQLQVQAAGVGAFDPATYGGDAAVAAAVRQAFLLTVPRDALVSTVVAPLWPEAVVASALLPTVGPDAGGDVAPSGPADIAGARRLLDEAGVTEPVAVHVLVNTTDPLRAAMLALITDVGVGRRVRGRAVHPGRRSRAGPGGRARGVGRGARAGAAVGPAGRLGAVAVADRGRDQRHRLVGPGDGRSRRDARADARPGRRRGPAGRGRGEPRRRRRGALAGAAAHRRRHARFGRTDRRDHPGGARRRAARARPGGPDRLVGVGAQRRADVGLVTF